MCKPTTQAPIVTQWLLLMEGRTSNPVIRDIFRQIATHMQQAFDAAIDQGASDVVAEEAALRYLVDNVKKIAY